MRFQDAELRELAAAAREVTEAGARVLVEGAGRKLKIEFKGEVNLVTDVDRRSEEVVKTLLQKRFPGFGILAEEGGESGATETRWIIDPLDGTTNFAHGQAFTAVSVGLESDGEIWAGATSAPFLGWTAWASRGGGAWMNDRRIRVSSTPNLDTALLATGYPYDRRTALDNNSVQHAAFVRLAQGVRRCGAATIDCALVAAGVYDGFWEPRLKVWDLAAGLVLVEEAGGRMTDYLGHKIDLYPGYVLASNGLIHDEMVAVLGDAKKKIDSGEIPGI